MGKWLVVIGTALVAVGLLIMALDRFGGSSRLPGDVIIKKGNFTFYFPLATSILISIVISLLIYIFQKLK